MDQLYNQHNMFANKFTITQSFFNVFNLLNQKPTNFEILNVYVFSIFNTIPRIPQNPSYSVHVRGAVNIQPFPDPLHTLHLQWDKYLGSDCMINGGSGFHVRRKYAHDVSRPR